MINAEIEQLISDRLTTAQEIITSRIEWFMNEVVTPLENRLEQMEKISAQLVAGYAELAATTETILSVLSNSSEEERQELQQALNQSRLKMLETLRQAQSSADEKTS